MASHSSILLFVIGIVFRLALAVPIIPAGAVERPSRVEEQSQRRARILKNMERVMGPLPAASNKVPLDPIYTESVRTRRYVRKKLTFAVGHGERVPAYLLIPNARKGRVPAVLCLHQTNGKLGKKEPAGLGGSPNLHYAAELAERGYATLVPDYPSFGEYPCDFSKSGFQSGSMKAIWNNMRAIDVLQSLPEVDPSRIGCIGHSLGGHNTMFTAAFDPRIKALVSCCGFTSFRKYYHGDLRGWTSPRYMPRVRTTFGLDPARMAFDFSDVIVSFAPRAFLAVAPLHDSNFDVSGVRDCIAAARPVYSRLGVRDHLAAIYPDCRHDFPPTARQAAYKWLDRWLKK